jgi:hypothetical protein
MNMAVQKRDRHYRTPALTKSLPDLTWLIPLELDERFIVTIKRRDLCVYA